MAWSVFSQGGRPGLVDEKGSRLSFRKRLSYHLGNVLGWLASQDPSYWRIINYTLFGLWGAIGVWSGNWGNNLLYPIVAILPMGFLEYVLNIRDRAFLMTVARLEGLGTNLVHQHMTEYAAVQERRLKAVADLVERCDKDGYTVISIIDVEEALRTR